MADPAAQTIATSASLPGRVPSSERARWTLYEEHKARLRARGLTPKQYDREIQRILDHLKL